MLKPTQFQNARTLIDPYIIRTEIRRSKELTRQHGANISLKLENTQKTRSFKIRGVAHKICQISKLKQKPLLVAASTGNHGSAYAHMLRKCNLKGELFIPQTITDVKREAIAKYGIVVHEVGRDCVEAECAASEYAHKKGATFISPYNDPDIILGQGSIAVELLDQLSDLDMVIVPVGGGGLISGIAGYLKQVKPSVQIVGVQPKNSPVMAHSIRAGHIIEMESLPTLADATAGGIEPDSITFNICKDLVDEWVLLSEDEILNSFRHLIQLEGISAEPGSAMTIAALNHLNTENKQIALIISGGKVDPRHLSQLELKP